MNNLLIPLALGIDLVSGEFTYNNRQYSFSISAKSGGEVPPPPVPPTDAKPWVHTYQTQTTYYVSPDGKGDGSTREKPMSFDRVSQVVQPGTLFWLLGGTYRSEGETPWYVNLDKDGIEGKDIVYRALPGERVIFDMSILISGDYTWLWGVEVTQVGNHEANPTDAAVAVRASDVHLINNFIHDFVGSNGVGGWNSGAGHVYYGNVIWANGKSDAFNPHNIYTQNDYAANGYKYYMDNVVMDAAEHASNNFSGYTESGYLTGFHVQRNFFQNGRFLIGGFNVPPQHNIVHHNWFDRAKVQFGYKRPSQVEFTNNFVHNELFQHGWLWGDGETIYTRDLPNVVTGNTFLPNTQRAHVALKTAAYYGVEDRREGEPTIPKDTVWNKNVYAGRDGKFFGTVYAKGIEVKSEGLAAWRLATEAAGCLMDANSTEQKELASFHEVWVNEYDPNRLLVMSYNNGDTPTLTIAVKAGHVKVFRPRELAGAPLLDVQSDGNVTIPLAVGTPVEAFIVIRSEVV